MFFLEWQREGAQHCKTFSLNVDNSSTCISRLALQDGRSHFRISFPNLHLLQMPSIDVLQDVFSVLRKSNFARI